MPTTKTALKEMRVAERRKDRNKTSHSQVKTEVTKAEALIVAGNKEAAKAGVKAAIKALDKEAEKGKCHPNAAARKKSRLMKKLNKASAK